MNPKRYPTQSMLVLMILFLGALACGGLSGVAERAEDVEHAAQTAQAIATQGGEIATQISESGLVQTGEALATEAADSGVVATLQAVASEIPGQVVDAQATIDIVLTEGAYGEVPPNIPLVDAQRDNFLGSSSLVSYTVALPFEQVLDFYRQEMPDYGWEPGEESNKVTPKFAKLFYQNPHQRVVVTISAPSPEDETLVLINIYEQ